MIAVAFWTPAWRLPERLPRDRTLWLVGGAIAVLLAVGSYWLMWGFPLSIDERMVLFDMAVFDRMQLAAPLAPEWQPYAKALVPGFLLNENMPRGLVSSYLPMNAMFRLAFSKLADPALFSPLLALVGGGALLDIARREFEGDGATCWVVLLVYALSAQMLVNAMTVYSMTPHMALNLIWLAAFLRGRRLGHSAAILTGFFATGLHQLVFHPFFVAPFILWRLCHREWRLVLLYAAAYAAIILWWANYLGLAAHEVAGSLHQPAASNFLVRVSATFATRGDAPVFTMLLNMLRFTAWQNLALLPLLSGAVAVALRDRGLPAVLLLGIAVWLAFLTVLVSFQGHGWGFRYLHPYLGSFALLAGYGYRELRATIGRKADGLVLTLSTITAVVTIPLLFTGAHRLIQPYVALEGLVQKQRTPFILIDTYPLATTDGRWAGNAIENVRNLPDLSNRPMRFSARQMTPELLVGLCRKGMVTLMSRASQHRVGFELNTPDNSPEFERLVARAKQQAPDCLVPAGA